jgi:hypothetical protein
MTDETRAQLIARLRAVTEEDAADVLANAAVSDPLTAQDVLAFYNWMLDRIIGEED